VGKLVLLLLPKQKKNLKPLKVATKNLPDLAIQVGKNPVATATKLYFFLLALKKPFCHREKGYPFTF